MLPEVRTYLKDIFDAARLAEEFLLGIRFEIYCELPEKRMAVERGIEIMGEAANQALKLDPSFDQILPEARKMISMRNILIHNYAAVHDETVWKTVKEDFPALLDRLRALLEKDDKE